LRNDREAAMGFDRIPASDGVLEHNAADLLSSPGMGAQTLPRVTILLSIYNGERYLMSQLASFLRQENVDWRLCWRDDGSSDASLAIMENFAETIGPERCLKSPSSGQHMGAAESFLQLLGENQDADFIAFADQDDCWLPAKLRRSVQLLGDSHGAPALYCARQILTDADFTHPTPSIRFSGKPGFPASLTQNVATGNTVVINAAAARLISETPAPQSSPHDWWSYIVVSACGGKIVYDNEPSTLYRQHARNMVGSPGRHATRAIAALRRGPQRYMMMMRRHAERLYEYRDRMEPQAVADLQLIRKGLNGGLHARVAALRCPAFTRATKLETALFRLWFLAY
jgi:glycosyltransferase involved in cell wall biosynthesis